MTDQELLDIWTSERELRQHAHDVEEAYYVRKMREAEERWLEWMNSPAPTEEEIISRAKALKRAMNAALPEAFHRSLEEWVRDTRLRVEQDEAKKRLAREQKETRPLLGIRPFGSFAEERTRLAVGALDSGNVDAARAWIKSVPLDVFIADHHAWCSRIIDTNGGCLG